MVTCNVQRSADRNDFWDECIDENNPFFVGIVQVHNDKMVTSLKAKSIVASPVHLGFLNFLKALRQSLIDHAYTSAAFLPVFNRTDEQDEHLEKINNPFEIEPSIVLLYDTKPFSMEKDARNIKLQARHEAKQTTLLPLISCVLDAWRMCVGRHGSAIYIWFRNAVIFHTEWTCLDWSMAERCTRTSNARQQYMKCRTLNLEPLDAIRKCIHISNCIKTITVLQRAL